ncbi:TetR family transcriptional regulator [Streptomonospora sp. S1-112]|uniref:TetR family transcriptional regulator n=1 Tax=Streptomonospora mangrovi TaxID=2883123 RepID=A0A9X3SEB3_9ACTN|nr:TetR family transcriptional regulator [Streptomonospora mangrovi]MDA0565708.1 TetR family transcriptional regulator [Streptomonospora mangrovi]
MTRTDRVAATRETLLDAAERLFAEHGLAQVSNRQISQEAGQGNNTAVSYHFGSKAGLVRAIVRRHAGEIERIRGAMVRRVLAAERSPGVRDWVACTVEPLARHLADLGIPSWYARFSAQAVSDPAGREAVAAEAMASPAIVRVGEELRRCLPDLPAEVRAERQEMARLLIVHTMAERERALAQGEHTPRDSWQRAAAGVTDALTGVWLAPVTEPAAGSWAD